MLNFRYKFVKKLGEGVYGDVYLAIDTKYEHEESRKYVALKRQKPNNFNDKLEGYSIALLREINILQELGSGSHRHPCMVELIDVFQLRDASPCIAIEYLPKGSLSSLL